MLLPPDVSGSLTVNLKDVTVIEALDTIRELYGYEYRLQGKRIFIEPNTIKTRVFQINYLSSQRHGSSVLRVSGNAMSTTGTTGGGGTTSTPTAGQTLPAGTGTSTASAGSDTSRVSMTSVSDFWGDLNRALATIVGTTDGRSVVVNPSSGVVLVRALPNELRNVEKYLKATQLVAERQVMLEAKIIDVTLSEDFPGRRQLGCFQERTEQPQRHRRLAARRHRWRWRHGANHRYGDGPAAYRDARPTRVDSRLDAGQGLHRPRLPDLELRRAAQLPRKPGQRLRAVVAAHRHVEQPEGGAQGR
jgi:hypothetical protein